MNSSIYRKLAFDNIRKNSRIYIPYIITCILTIAMYYIMKSLSLNEGIKEIIGAETVEFTLELGTHVIEIFAFVFLFYANSFLTKNRKKEFGLLNVLGMEKRHIAKLIAYESIYTGFISFAGGFISGILLDKLMYLVITKILKADIKLGFYISGESVIYTLAVFGILFFLIFLNSLRMIHLSKPIELLKGGNVGEKEPKAKWLTAILGFVCLGAGYYIAVTVKNPVEALTFFFVAVVLVIVGTYLVFTAGSIALLKILKKNKGYYYKTNHFISVSGMIYRMKQNAVGLANICILSTMVLVMISSTSSLIIGTNDILETRYPYQINIYKYDNDESSNQDFINIVHRTAENENIKIKCETSYTNLEFMAVYDEKNTFETNTSNRMSDIDNVYYLFFVTAQEYSEYTGDEVKLENDTDVYFWYNRDAYKQDYFNLFGEKYNIVKHTDKFVGNGELSSNALSGFGIVVKDMSVMQKLYEYQKEAYGDNASNIEFFYGIDIMGDENTQIDFSCKVESEIESYANEKEVFYNIGCREKNRNDIYGLYGSLFFLGMFLGVMFIIATILIIYYKQISEGYDDKNRFEIMQKVGMTEREVKSSIHSQVLTVFFMPLILAGVHIIFAFPIIKKILLMLMLTNTRLYITCTIISFLVFALIYVIIYLMTAKIYYKIVKR